jgi:hypothetical protein
MNILPIKVKRHREPKFTEKRNPYKKYLNAKWKWTDIFTEIDNKESSIKNISKKYNINYVTLRQKYSYYKNKKIKKPNEENRGGSKRKLNNEQENELYKYIKEKYTDTEEILNNNIIKEIVKEKFKDNKIEVSEWWISNFKKRWHLSTQKVKPSKIAINLPSENEQKIFLDECKEYKKKVDAKFFLTMMKQAIIL